MSAASFFLGALATAAIYHLVVHVPFVSYDLHPKPTSKPMKILMPLPNLGFDPTEAAVPWKILHDLGHQITFATETGVVSACDPHILSGFVEGLLLKVFPEPAKFYDDMIDDPAFRAPIAYKAIVPEEYDAMLIPGGHHPGMRGMLESLLLQHKTSQFWALRRPVGAICHGVLLLARSRDSEGASLLFHRNTTTVPSYLEAIGHYLTHHILGMDRYQLSTTWPLYTQQEVTYKLASPAQMHTGPLDVLAGLLPGSAHDHSRTFLVEDGHYLSARFWGDAYVFALRFAKKLNEADAAATATTAAAAVGTAAAAQSNQV